VTDEGNGIPEALLPRLFVPFDRLTADLGDVEGTGLGLALSKRLAEMMGGDITVASEVGQGTTFILELVAAGKPAARRPSSGELESLTHAAGLRTATVLLIEDNVSNVTLVERILGHAQNVRVIPAMQGGLGLELARQHNPDVILLDLHLPDMSGEDVLAELARDPATRDVPVIILSADATPGQVGRMRALGIGDYLTKPLDVGQFIETVRRVLDERRGVADDLPA
jgi:CheY-like chemotaxis protein